MTRFPDRATAGRLLAQALSHYAGHSETIVLGLPRGGIPVAAEVAAALHLPLDVFTVRKLGVPWDPELAVGAIATGDVAVFDHESMRSLGLSMRELAPVIEREEHELARRDAVFRAGRPPLVLHGRTVIAVDDGIATGATMTAAIEALRKLGAARVVVATPVAAEGAREAVRALCDEWCCLEVPRAFYGVGAWYEDFHDMSDAEVVAVLATHRGAPQAA